jgi:hypothetical protein
MIRKLKSEQFCLYSRKKDDNAEHRRNLGKLTFVRERKSMRNTLNILNIIDLES